MGLSGVSQSEAGTEGWQRGRQKILSYIKHAMFVFIIGLLLLLILSKGTKSNQVLVDGYKTKYFTSYSKATFEQIKTLDFAVAEDRFMECEYLTVHQGVSHLKKAFGIHQRMTETYPNLNLNYHHLALNQMGRPSKEIDPSLRCS